MTAPKRLIALLVSLLVLGGGGGLVYAWTLGFSAFTSYSYALNKAGPLPRAAPDISFIDQFGNERRLASLRGRHVLLHVFYGSCLTICPIVIEELRELYSDLSAVQQSKLVILSISVDRCAIRPNACTIFGVKKAHSRAGSWRNLRMARSIR
jgi:cytochrome oxidase Cu insertion factor (SCO1/SenC/PrrC family)